MKFTTLLPLILLILLPIIILLYILKQKAQEHQVSSLFLWQEMYKNLEATTPWEKLKNNLLMYIQLLTMVILIFSLTAPYLTAGVDSYKNIVIVIDNSGSMNILYDDDKTRLDISKQKAIDYLNEIKSGMSVTVISSSNSANIELASSTDKNLIKSKINNIEETDLEGDVNLAVQLIRSMSNQWESYEAVFFTDTNAQIEDINGYIVDMSNEIKNASIDYVSYLDNKDKTMDIIAQITNQSDYNIESDLNLYIDEKLIDIKNFKIPPNENDIVYFEKVPITGQVIKAEINEKDGLENDNIAYDLVHDSSEKKVLLITEQNIFLEKAVLTNSDISLYKTNSIENINEDEKFDLYIYDAICPDVLPDSNVLIIAPNNDIYDKNKNLLFNIEETVSGAAITTLETEITNYISNYTFGVNELYAIKKPIWAESFLKFNEYSAGFIGNYDGKTIAVIAFDIHQSDLPLQTQFPILINNLIDNVINSNLVSKPVLIAGEQTKLNIRNDVENIEIKYPNGNIEKVSSIFENTKWTGIYEATEKAKGLEEKITEHIVVNFPVSSESKIQKMTQTVKENNKVVSADEVRGGTDLRYIFIIICILALIIEWIVYVKQS